MILRKKYAPFFTFLALYYNVCVSQLLQLNIYDNENKKIMFTKTFSSKMEIEKSSRKFLYDYYSNGYLLADYDSITHQDNIITYHFQKHKLFQWVKLTRGNLEPKLYYDYFQPKKFEHQAVRYPVLIQFFDKIISYYENNGYPFASIKLDSIRIDSNSISASLLVNKNQKVIIDSIIVQGNLKVNKKFLYKYIDIKPSALYNEKKLKSVDNKLKKLPFVTIRQPSLIRITDKYNKFYIFAEHKNVSQFDGILGIQPDAAGKTIITGNLKIKLINVIFKNAEQLEVDWQRLQALTQQFKLSFSIPYLAGTPFGTQYQLSIFKQDTSFIDVQNQMGLSYYFSGINYLQFFYKQRDSRLISTYGLSSIITLPDYADITTEYYGCAFYFNNLNNINNPMKGWQTQSNVSIGNKNIRKNPKVNDAVYKNLLLHSLQYQIEGIIENYLPKILTKYTALKLSLKYGYIGGNTNLFKNELFRIGGLKSIRGFNEQSIFSDTYVIPSIEYRFLYNENGYIMIFSDAAYYTTNYNNQKFENKLYSFGAGIQFDTKAGLFNLIYAIGNSFGQSPDFRTGKIHAGLINIF